MPLAVELAAARVATLAPAELLARLDRSLGVLARGPRDLAERHRSLRAALDWTHALLEPGEQALLARLAAFAGPAPLDAVEAVAEVAGERGPVDALEALSGLVDASFVQRTDSREYGVRYTVAQAVRDFAAERLAASGEEHAVRAAHAAHVAAVGRDLPRRRHAGPRRRPGPRARGRVRARRSRGRASTRPHCTPAVAAALGLVLNDYAVARAKHTPSSAWRSNAPASRTRPPGGPPSCAPSPRSRSGRRSEAPLIEAGLGGAARGRRHPAVPTGARASPASTGVLAEDPERALEHTTEALALARGRPHLDDLALALAEPRERPRRARSGWTRPRRCWTRPRRCSRSSARATIDADGMFDELAAARGDWARAARPLPRERARHRAQPRPEGHAPAPHRDRARAPRRRRGRARARGHARTRSANRSAKRPAIRSRHATGRRSTTHASDSAPERAARADAPRRGTLGGRKPDPRGGDGAGGLRHLSDVKPTYQHVRDRRMSSEGRPGLSAPGENWTTCAG